MEIAYINEYNAIDTYYPLLWNRGKSRVKTFFI